MTVKTAICCARVAQLFLYLGSILAVFAQPLKKYKKINVKIYKKGLIMRPTPDKMSAFMAQLKKKMNLKSLVVTLAAIVVFTTTYLLILPAFTLDKEEAAEQGGIDVAVEQTVETVDEEAPAEQAEEPAAEQNESADAVTEAEEPAAKEEVKEETASPKQKDSDVKEEKKEDKEEVKLLSKKKELTAEKEKSDDFTISAVVDKNAKVPEDVFLQATELTKDTKDFDYDKYYKDALKALKKDSNDVKGIKTIKFYDISLEAESQEKSVEPKAPVNVKIAYEDGLNVKDADNIRIVHFAEQKNGEVKAEILDSKENKVETTVNKKSELTEASFDTEGFSVFAVVGTETETVSIDYLAASGKTYQISVDIPKDAEVPAGSELVVKEIVKGTDDYDQYVEQVAELFGKDETPAELTFAHLFDISIYKDSEKIQPKKDVKVNIKLKDKQDLSKTNKIGTVHFAENGTDVIYPDTVINNEKLEAVTFDAEGFSVYAIVGMSVTVPHLTADGKTLNVSVSFDPREMLPEGAVLDISEVDPVEEPETYAKRNERLADALFEEYGNVAITDVRYLNISIRVPDEGSVQTWKDYEPVYPVDVKVDYTEPMDTTNPGVYKDYNDGSKKVTPDKGNHIVGVHYTEDGAEILETADEKTKAGVSETITHTDSFSEYDFAYIYEYEIIDTDYDYDPSPISKMTFNASAVTKAAPGGLLRGAGDTPAHTKTLGDNGDGTHKLSLTVTGDADTDNKASNANVIIVFDTSNSMVNYYVPMANGARGSNNADGSNSFVLYRDTNGTEAVDGYTGTVYTRTWNGRRWVYSEYNGQRYSRTIRRADAAEKVLYDFAHALYGYQNEDDPSTPEHENENIQTALITFNATANRVQGWTSTETDITNRVSSTGAGGSKKLNNSSGTNWEDGLREAKTLIGTADSDPTFVVFITDGQPTQWHNHTSGYDTTGQGYVEARDEAYDVQQACAATGTDSHGALYSIYAYGTEADYLDDLMYYAYNHAVHTEDLDDAGDETFETEGYYNAGDSEALAEAVNDIFAKIVKTLGITAVSVSDGTTSQVQTTSGDISHLLEVDTSSYEYWLSINTVDNKFTMKDIVSGEDIEYTVSSSGGNVTISWTKDGTNYSETYEGTYSSGTARIKWTKKNSFYNFDPPAATFTDPKVDWDLSSLNTLLDGVTYEVTFDVYPSQYTLDLIADLKNGYVEYDSLDTNIKKYLLKDGSDYILATNTTATLTYTDNRTDDGPQTSNYVNPDPVGTSAAQSVSITKDWSNYVDNVARPDELKMHITRDGTDRYELILNDADHWQDSAFISFGIVTVHDGVVKVKTPGHDYSFSEPLDMEYYWELDAPTLRPMKINGVDTMLVKVAASEAPSMSGDNNTAEKDGYTYYKFTIDGEAMYYRADEEVASIYAENHRRSYLQIVKNVENPKEGDTFDFTTTVTNSKADSGSESEIDSDYYVWFSVFDKDGNVVISDDLASGDGLQRETNSSGAYTGYYYIPSGNKVTVKMQDGYSLRFLNLPIGSTYDVSETLDAYYENVSIEGLRKYKEETEGDDGSTTVVDKSEPAGEVEDLGISGTIDYADSRYEIDYTNNRVVTDVSATKAWINADGSTTAPANAKVTFTLYEDGQKTNPPKTVELDGTADENGESESWVATFSDLPRYKVVDGVKQEITYTIFEEDDGKWVGYDRVETEPVPDGGTIHNQQATLWVSFKKTDMGTTPLPGAVFTFNDGGKDWSITSGDDGIMTATVADESTAKSKFELAMRPNDPYVLAEETAPDGYIKLEYDVNVVVASTGVTATLGTTTTKYRVTGTGTEDDPYVVIITNSAGEELPMTGGIGTTIFYILGSILAVGCGIVLVSRRRMRNTR